MFQGKRVFITGVTGFIGSHLARRLIFKGANVSALVYSSDGLYRIRDILSSINCCKGDICDRTGLAKLIKQAKPQIIFHMASFGVQPGQSGLLKLAQININGLVNLLSGLEKIDFERFIYAGTSAEYGPSTAPMNEEQMLNPGTFYGATKAAGTLITQAFGRIHNKKTVILRPFYVYGPGEDPGRFVSTVIRTGLAGKQLKISALSEKRDFIYIDDVVSAFMLAATKNIVTPALLNIGTGREHRLKDVIEIVERKIGRKIKVKEGVYPSRPWKSQCWAADISKTQKALGWKPAHNLSTGIDKTIAWFVRLKKGARS